MIRPAGSARRLEPQTISLLAVLASALLFVSMSTSVKWLQQHYPVTMIIWARYFFYALIVGLWRPRRLVELPKARHLGLQIARSALLLIATAGQFIALGYLQIAEVSAIGFLTPLLVTALSAPLLGERVGALRWLAVGAGLIGALIVVRPGLGTMHWASLVAVAFTIAYALYQISTRVVRDADPGITLLFGSLVGAAVMSAVVPFAWVTPTLPDLLLMGWVALVATSGHALIILALRHGEASLVAAFSYTQLLWALASGWFVFGTFPDAWTLTGAAIIVASGLMAILSRKVVA